MKTKIEYQQDISHAERVRRLVMMPEFEVLKLILKRMRDEDIEKLITRENSESRARINFNQDLIDEIQKDIDRGKVAEEALKAERFSESPKES